MLRRLPQGEKAEGGKSKGSKVQKIAKDEILMVSTLCLAAAVSDGVVSACSMRLIVRAWDCLGQHR